MDLNNYVMLMYLLEWEHVVELGVEWEHGVGWVVEWEHEVGWVVRH